VAERTLLVAAAAAAQEDAVLLFADHASAASTATVLRGLAPDVVTVVGGPHAISDELVGAILAPDAALPTSAADRSVSR
jgi:hypothetical protein